MNVIPNLRRLLASFSLLCVSLCGVDAAETAVPGSATMPPKEIDAPLPARPAKDRAEVKVGVWIKKDGFVDTVEAIEGTESWRPVVVDAVKRWRFEPVMWKGEPIEARVEILFQPYLKTVQTTISPLPNLPGERHTPDEFGLTKPLLSRDPEILYPLISRATRGLIVAAVKFVVMEDGTIGYLTPVGRQVEHAWRATADCLLERSYTPGAVRDRGVQVEYKQVINFRYTGKPIEELKGASYLVDPVFPYERLIAGEGGHAVVRLTLDASGVISTIELVEASHPDFGASLLAAAENWEFSPEAVGENKVRVYRHEFLIEEAPYASRRMAEQVRAGKPVSVSGKGLDQKLQVAWSPPLTYPRAFRAQPVEGTAKIELVIDRSGLAQFPRVVEASHPEFGWAAATFVNGLRFEPLTRNGAPTELRVIFPLKFPVPKTTEAATADGKTNPPAGGK